MAYISSDGIKGTAILSWLKQEVAMLLTFFHDTVGTSEQPRKKSELLTASFVPPVVHNKRHGARDSAATGINEKMDTERSTKRLPERVAEIFMATICAKKISEIKGKENLRNEGDELFIPVVGRNML